MYENDREFSVLMKWLLALPFVPEDDVISVFEDFVVALLQEPEVEVVAYFKATYIRGMQFGRRRKDPRFPVTLWNHFEDGDESAPKTTNCWEGQCPEVGVRMYAPNHVRVSEGSHSGHHHPASSAPECFGRSVRRTHQQVHQIRAVTCC